MLSTRENLHRSGKGGEGVKTVIRGVVLAAGLVLCAVYLLPAVFFGVWSLGTWVGLAAGAVMAIGAKRWPAITEFCRKRRIRWLSGGILTVSVVLVFYLSLIHI